MSQPFDPFSLDEDHDNQIVPTTPNSKSSRGGVVSLTSGDEPSKAATDDTSKTTNTTSKRLQRQIEDSRHKSILDNHVGDSHSLEGGLPFGTSRSASTASKRLPPRLNVKLSYHEEVTSSSIVETQDRTETHAGSGGSLSRLFVTGKIRVQVESTDANYNAPFCLKLSGSMASLAKFICHDGCILLDEQSSRFVTFTPPRPSANSSDKESLLSFKVDIPKAKVEPVDIVTYSFENVQTQNMPILVQTKATIHNQKCRIGIQIRSNLSNVGDLHEFTIVLSIPPALKEGTVKITRGNSGIIDEIKHIVTWKIAHLGHGNSCLVSIEADMDSHKFEKMGLSPFLSKQHQHQMLEDQIQLPVLVRCCSKMDQISDFKLSCVALEDAPASICVQTAKSFRLLHRVCVGNS
ncbi:hypothetical protein HJC23_011638 [Cyclotella cryptica]|uniref:MHD domain-containing protein n=1 Tax=Cyclotella cryptica TaxID=29204 RepID=A0ABD3QS14_9STRA|eukprot:CCRYP_002782-RA/>CCRYP_002782-RA protein AED:0.38 eAED:0.38 QI:61/1/1/1/1/1/2/315/405